MRYFKTTLKCFLILFLAVIFFAVVSIITCYILFIAMPSELRYAEFPLSLVVSFCLTLGVLVTGVFCWRKWGIFRHIILAIAVLAFVLISGICLYYRGGGVNQAEDRQRWLQSIDASNAKSGLIKDTNGNWDYVGVTNVQNTNQGSAK